MSTTPQETLKIVIQLRPPNAMIGVSMPGKDPHLVSLEMKGDALDLDDVLKQVPDIVNVALERFKATAQFPKYARPAPPPRPAPARAPSAGAARPKPKPGARGAKKPEPGVETPSML